MNINTPSGVEQLLLGPSLTKPRPSVSGDSMKKTVLIFHCEFSAKRAPTLYVVLCFRYLDFEVDKSWIVLSTSALRTGR